MRTDVRAHAERLVHPLATARTVLRREVWCDGYDRDIMQPAIGVDPPEEAAPCGIADGLGQLVVLDQVVYLQVFIGNQVVRRDKRACRLPGKILTLPTHFQIRFCQSLPGFVPVLAFLLFLRDAPMQTRELLFSLAQEARVLDGRAFRVGIECFQSHIDTDLLGRSLMYYLSLGLYAELHEVAIGSTDNADSFDHASGKGFDVLLLVAYQPQASNTAAVGEGDVLAILVEFPSRGFVFDGNDCHAGTGDSPSSPASCSCSSHRTARWQTMHDPPLPDEPES